MERRFFTMAIYHLCIKIISRGKGKSAVAASAYRSGEKIKNEYDGIVHDLCSSSFRLSKWREDKKRI